MDNIVNIFKQISQM